MFTKQMLIDSLKAETAIIKHLATKVPEGGLEYRPTEGQRSTWELMQYMTRMAITPAYYAVDGHWERAEAIEEDMQEVTVENFADEMDRQMEMLEAVISGVDGEAAKTDPAKMPWGSPTTVAAGLVDMALKCMVAYRMQFFLYVKAAGAHDIGPANCWVGVDMPRPKEEEEAGE